MKIERIGEENEPHHPFEAVAQWYASADSGESIRISDLPSFYVGRSTEYILESVTDAIYWRSIGRRTVAIDPAVVTVERADNSRTPYSWIITKL